IGLGETTLFHFFPTWIYDRLNLTHRLADGMAIHFLFMWLFAINGLLYVSYTLWSGEWRYLFPDRNSIREAIQVAMYDLRLSKIHPPQTKYNGAQKIAYTSILLMGIGSLLTGLAIYKPIQVGWLTSLVGGYEMARWLHFWLTMGYVAFFCIHIAQVVKTGWNNFQGMVTGFDIPAKEVPGE
ncbi:MAG: cytochrome b/b6 domain-containing protein, partial [Bryobacteraceae bacterium]